MVEIAEIPIKKIFSSQLNPRKSFGELEGISDSIKQTGILAPLIVRPSKSGYEVVVGERRYLSAKKIGLKKVPAIIKELDNVQALELMMIENIHRRDLTPAEKDESYSRYLMHIANSKGYDLSEEKQFHDVINTASQRTGISPQIFRIRLRTMGLSEILEKLGIKVRHEYVKRISLRASLGVPAQINVAKLSEKMNLTWAELEECLKVISQNPNVDIMKTMEKVKISLEKTAKQKEKEIKKITKIKFLGFSRQKKHEFKPRKVITPIAALEKVMNSTEPSLESKTAFSEKPSLRIPKTVGELSPSEKTRIESVREKEFRKIIKERELKNKIISQKRPMVNLLNELDGVEWLKFTKSWYVYDAQESDLEEERALTIDTEEHPATFSPSMISIDIRFFTKRKDVVLDPFVGIGSTLAACIRTGRKGIGIDINKKFAEITKRRIENDSNQKIIVGDAWEIEKYKLPKINYCITSPPYFEMLKKIDVTQKKRIAAGLPADYGNATVLAKDVDSYVNNLVKLFSKIHKLMAKDSYATVILQNFREKNKMVPLAWKFAQAMDETGKWDFKGERIWCQGHKTMHPFGYPSDWVSNVHHHYCLIFKKVNK